MRRLAARGIDDHLHSCSAIWFSFLFPGRNMTRSFSHRASSTGDGPRLYMSVSSYVARCFPFYHWHACHHISFHHMPVVLFSIHRLLGPHFKQLIIVVALYSSPLRKWDHAVGTQADGLIRTSQCHRNTGDLASFGCTDWARMLSATKLKGSPTNGKHDYP